MIIGSGASAAAGIPDFREPEGVYKEVAERFLLPDPLSLFDAHYFVTNPLALCLVARSLLPGVHAPAPRSCAPRGARAAARVHGEHRRPGAAAGVERVVACHGTVASATCLACKHRVEWRGGGAARPAQLGPPRAPRCGECSHALNLLKPDLRCFGETGVDLDACLRDDLGRAGALVVLGAGCARPARRRARAARPARAADPHRAGGGAARARVGRAPAGRLR